MSTAYSSAKQQYIGNGVTTEWGFDFPIKKHSELKVYLKRSGQTQVLLEDGVDYSFVTENTIAFPIKTGEAKLQATDVLALQRESVFESEYNFSNQQRLEPEEVMHADDNLERQIQELKRDSESAIKVLPTSNVDPNTFFEQVERVYGSVDNIDTVANDKANLDKVAGSITKVNTVAGDIESVKTVANNIKSVVVDATNISDIKTVAGSISNVNKTAGSIDNVNAVAPSISSVNTVSANISSVNTAASNMAAIKAAPTAAANAAQSAANAANSATASANSATASANSANNSHIWAEGTDAQVAALGGVHSSKGWAEQSTSVNISLTNSPYTTNRILEIPQDIKLELNNGTLTLKAGSTYYKCDGSFTKVTTSKDYSMTNASNGYRLLFFIGNGFDIPLVQDCNSGTSEPTTGNKWFNTSNNILYSRVSGNWQQKTNYSLPLAIITVSDGTVTSIDQIFNGFGYIGSTVFALPGVQVQTPNGRNADGTYKSVIRTVDSVKTFNAGAWGTRNLKLIVSGDTLNILYETQAVERFTYNKQFSSDTTTYSYDENTGQWWYSPDQSSWAKSALNILGSVTVTSGKITSFEPFTVDSVLNSSLSNLSEAGRATLNGKASIDLNNLSSTGEAHFANPDLSNLSAAGRATLNGKASIDLNNLSSTGEAHFANPDLSNLSAAGQAKFDAKANVSNTVTTDTAQTISGVKTFKSVVTAELEPINFIAKNPTMDVNQTPSAKKYVGYDFRDKNNVRLGYIGISQGTDGTIQYEIQKLGNYVEKIEGITPPAGSGGNEIVTAGWFRQSGCTARTVIETYKNGTNWYRIWSDGWKEQGGRIASGNTSVTFLKPFTDTNYCVSMAQKGNSSAAVERVSVESLSTTSMLIKGTDGNSTPAYWRACGY